MANAEQQNNWENPMARAPAWEEPALKYYINVIRRRIWVVVTLFVVVVTIGLVNAFRAPKIYQSATKLIVEKQSPRIKGLEGMTPDARWWDPDYYNTQVELIKSRAILGKAYERLNEISDRHRGVQGKPPKTSFLKEMKRTVLAVLGSKPSPAPERWEQVKGNILVQHVDGTYFVMIKGESEDPVYAAELANEVARAFKKYHVAQKREVHGEAFRFLQTEKRKEQKALIVAEGALQAFREQADSVSLSDDKAKQPVFKRLDELNSELTNTQLKRTDLTAQLKVVREILEQGALDVSGRLNRLSTVPAIKNDLAVIETQKQLVEAQKNLASLKETYGFAHPLMKAANVDLDVRKKQFKNALDQSVMSLVNEVRTLKAKEGEINKHYEEQKRLALVSAKEAFEFNRLKHEVSRHQRIFELLSQRLQEVDISAGFTSTNVKIIENAAPSVAPIRPNKRRIVMFAAFIGAFLGVGLAFFFENLDDTIKTPEDLRKRLDVPLLGFVPKMAESESATENPATRGIISVAEPISSIAEAYRTIRTSLFFSIPADEVKIVAFTSCGPGEGKTTTTANLALSIARSGKRVLLIDADLHRPMLHRIFGMDSSNGLTNYLVGDISLEDAIKQYKYEGSVVENLDILTAGPESPNPSELLGSQRMKELLVAARGVYDWVMVDTPPVLFVSYAAIVSTICQGVILVVRAGANNRSILVRTKEQLEGIHARIIGSVLNSVVVTRVGRYYSNYYYHGYSQYSRDYHRSYYSSKDRKGDESKKGKTSRGKNNSSPS